MNRILLLMDLPSDASVPNAPGETEDAVLALGAAAASSRVSLVCSLHSALAPLLAVTAECYSSGEFAEGKTEQQKAEEDLVVFYSDTAEEFDRGNEAELLHVPGARLLREKFETVLEKTLPMGAICIGNNHRMREEVGIYHQWCQRHDKSPNLFTLSMAGEPDRKFREFRFGRHFLVNPFAEEFWHLLAEHERKSRPEPSVGKEFENEKRYIPYAVITQMIIYEILNGKPWRPQNPPLS